MLIMIRFFLFLLLITLSPLGNAQSTPEHTEGDYNVQGSLRYFIKKNKWTGMFEYDHKAYHEDIRTNGVKVGGRYRFLPTTKLGIFLKRIYGERHDDDWVLRNSTWQWQDSLDRGETILSIEYSYRRYLDWVIEHNWTGGIRVTYEYNFFNQKRTLILKPEVNYYIFEEGKPLYNFFLQTAPEISESMSISRISSSLGCLYYVDHQFQIGGYLSAGWSNWNTSSEYIQQFPGTEYHKQLTSMSMGLMLTINTHLF